MFKLTTERQLNYCNLFFPPGKILCVDKTQYWQNCGKSAFSQCIGEITNDKTVSKVSYQYPSKCKMPRLFDLAILLGH